MSAFADEPDEVLLKSEAGNLLLADQEGRVWKRELVRVNQNGNVIEWRMTPLAYGEPGWKDSFVTFEPIVRVDPL